MDRNADPPFADLPQHLVDRLRNLETELSRELDEPIVLLAYEDVPGTEDQNHSR